jgi:predicted O-methyltransferase YrrM
MTQPGNRETPFHRQWRRIKFSLRHPTGGLAYFRGRDEYEGWWSRRSENEFKRAARKLAGVGDLEYAQSLRDLHDTGLAEVVRNRAKHLNSSVDTILGYTPYRQFYYALVRALRPSVVVETGVWFGMSSAFLLQALHDNDHGTLYSIDLPNHQYICDDGEPGGDSVGHPDRTGVLVPDYLRYRWQLCIGKVQDRLVPILQTLGAMDLYVRDSEHTYTAVTFELTHAWEHLSKGGVLLSDDVHWTSAFAHFADSVGAQAIVFQRARSEYMGGLIKP